MKSVRDQTQTVGPRPVDELHKGEGLVGETLGITHSYLSSVGKLSFVQSVCLCVWVPVCVCVCGGGGGGGLCVCVCVHACVFACMCVCVRA